MMNADPDTTLMRPAGDDGCAHRHCHRSKQCRDDRDTPSESSRNAMPQGQHDTPFRPRSVMLRGPIIVHTQE